MASHSKDVIAFSLLFTDIIADPTDSAPRKYRYVLETLTKSS